MAGIEGGNGAEQDGGGGGAQNGEAQDPAVDRDLAGAGCELTGEIGEQADAAHGEQQAEAGGEQGHDQALGQKLPQKASAARAHGGADDQFLLAARHTGEDQVGDVGAGDQQHEGGGSQEDQQHGLGLLDQILAEERRGGGVAETLRIRFRVVLLEVRGDGRDVAGTKFERGFGFEAAEDAHHAEIAIRDHARRGPRRTGHSRHVDIVLVGILRDARQHADDGVRPVVHLIRFADDTGIAAFVLLPVVVAEQQDGRRAGDVVFGAEGAAEERADAEEIEESRRDDAGTDAAGLAAAEQGEGHAMVFHDAGEG